MHVEVQRLVWEGRACVCVVVGGGGNGCMYNASVVHFQLPIAHDAADTSSDHHMYPLSDVKDQQNISLLMFC